MADIARLSIKVDSSGLVAATNQSKKLKAEGEKTEKAFISLKNIIRTVFAGAAIKQAIQFSDTLTQINSKLNIVISSQKELVEVEQALFDISQKNRTGYEETADLFTKLRRSFDETEVSSKKILEATDALGKAILISGGSAESANAAIIQLSQGMSSGVLRGEELNSVMEQTPRVAIAIADSLGVTIGQLREMGKEGQLTADVVLNGLVSQLGKLTIESEKVETTASKAFVVLENSLIGLVGGFSKATGAGESFADLITNTASGIDKWVESNQLLLNQDIPNFLRNMGTILGPIASAADTLASAFGNISRAVLLINTGMLTFGDLATSNAEELAELLRQFEEDPTIRLKAQIRNLKDEYQSLSKIFRSKAETKRFNEIASEIKAINAEIRDIEEDELIFSAFEGFAAPVISELDRLNNEIGRSKKNLVSVQGPGKKVSKRGGSVLSPEDVAGNAAREKAIESSFKSVRESLLSEEQLENESYLRRKAAIELGIKSGLDLKAEGNVLLENEEKRHQERLTEISKNAEEDRYLLLSNSQAKTASGTAQLFGNLASLASQGGKDSFEAYKVFAIAQAGIAATLSVLGVLGDLTIPTPLRLPLAFSIGALATAQVANIASQDYQPRAVGGQVQPGTSYLVGERGPELLTMGNSRGNVTPNSGLGTGGEVKVTNVYQMSPGLSGTVQAEVMRMVPLITAQTKQAVESAISRGGSMARAVGQRR